MNSWKVREVVKNLGDKKKEDALEYSEVKRVTAGDEGVCVEDEDESAVW